MKEHVAPASALRLAIIVGAVCEVVAMYWMGRSGPLQGDWRRGLQLLVIFLVPAALTWALVMFRGRPGRSD